MKRSKRRPLVFSVLCGLLLWPVFAGGQEWIEGLVRFAGDGAPAAGVRVVLLARHDVSHYVEVHTDAEGRFRIDISRLTGGGAAQPQAFELLANYPNPFNPGTTIPYRLNTAGQVSLEVYDLLGQRLRVLVDGTQPPGSYATSWDARDGVGQGVAAGVYIYRLTVDGRSVSRKMLLVDGGVPSLGRGAGTPPPSEGGIAAAGAFGEFAVTISGVGVQTYADPEVRDGWSLVVERVAPGERPKPAQEASRILGDVNRDARVDIVDALIVATYELDPTITIPNQGDITLGDVNGDGWIDLTDAQIIASYSVYPDNPTLPPGIGQRMAAGLWPAGYVHCGDVETAIVDVTNPTTGKTWMDRNLGTRRAATSSTDAAAYGDLYQWGRFADGHQCRTSSTTSTLHDANADWPFNRWNDRPDHKDFISSSSGHNWDWRRPPNDYLWQGVNGVNNPCPSGYRLPTDAELEAEVGSWRSDNAAGAFASPLKWTVAGDRNVSQGSVLDVGSLGYYWSSTVDGTEARLLLFSSNRAYVFSGSRGFGFSVRCLKDEPSAAVVPTLSTASIRDITPTSATSGGAVTDDGGAAVTVRGVVWSTAENPTVESHLGLTADGAGAGDYTSSLTGLVQETSYYVRAYATNSAGTAYGAAESFTTLPGTWPAWYVHCRDVETAIVEVINPTTGKTWMDRNLGARRAATSSTDAAAYGDRYQWGRLADGHQCRDSSTGIVPPYGTQWLSSTDRPGTSRFILFGPLSSKPWDWRSPQNDTLWQGVDGVNNPCPRGYRLPTEAELEAERQSWISNRAGNNAAGAFASPLKWPVAGQRMLSDGSFYGAYSFGLYWSSTVDGEYARALFFSGFAGMFSYDRASGFSVRCIKD